MGKNAWEDDLLKHGVDVRVLNDILRRGSEWDYKIRGMIGSKISKKRGLREDCYSYVQEALWRAVKNYNEKKSNGKTFKNWLLLNIDSAIKDFLRKMYAKKNKQLVFRPFNEMQESDGLNMPIPDPEDNPDKPLFDTNSMEYVQAVLDKYFDNQDKIRQKREIEEDREKLEGAKEIAEAAGDTEVLELIAEQEAELKDRAIDLKLEDDLPPEEENYETEEELEIRRLEKEEQEELRDEAYILNELAEANKNCNSKRRLEYAKKKRQYGDVVPDYQYPNYQVSQSVYRPILDDMLKHLDEWELNIVNKMLDGWTVTEIAKDLGYADHSFISKELKRIKRKTVDLISKGTIDTGTENEFVTNSIYEGNKQPSPKSQKGAIVPKAVVPTFKNRKPHTHKN